jgi:hypothetical protein
MYLLPGSEDRFHGLTGPGSYEWSYFDGLSEDGEWGFVAIWFRGCPMSPYYTAAIDRWLADRSAPPPDPDDHAAFSLGLYHRGRRVYSVLHERPRDLFQADTAGPDVRLGGNAVRGGKGPDGGITYLFFLDTKLGLQTSRLSGDIEINALPSAADALATTNDPAAEGHFWVPAALDGTFTARLDLWRLGRGVERIRFGGRAYHDRNFGTSPLHHLKADWHWGRVHSGARLFVYFAVVPDSPDEPSFRRLILLENGRLVDAVDDFTLDAEWRGGGLSTLRLPGHLAGRAPGGDIAFDVRDGRALDSGPFYHRMLSRIDLARDGERWIEGSGITEFLRPPRLGVAPFRPFVKFRVRRG